MIVLAKSSTYLNPKQLRKYVIEHCPMRVFKAVDLIADKNGLCFCYRMPSKARLDLSLTCPVDDSIFDYLCDNELRISRLSNNRLVIDSLRQMQKDARSAIKEFCNGLTPDEVEKFSPRIVALQNSVNNDCVPKVTQSITKLWNETVRQPIFETIKQVEL